MQSTNDNAMGIRPEPNFFGNATQHIDASRWYVFRSVVRQEATAEANLTNQGFRHFLPKILITRRHARRFITVRQWLFPRYGFVQLDLTRERWRSVNGTFGVERLVMLHDEPQAVPNGIIENLSKYVDDDGLIDFSQGLVPGTEVRVKLGPMAGAFGVLQQLDGKGRVEILLEIMGGSVRTKLARDLIELVRQ